MAHSTCLKVLFVDRVIDDRWQKSSLARLCFSSSSSPWRFANAQFVILDSSRPNEASLFVFSLSLSFFLPLFCYRLLTKVKTRDFTSIISTGKQNLRGSRHFRKKLNVPTDRFGRSESGRTDFRTASVSIFSEIIKPHELSRWTRRARVEAKRKNIEILVCSLRSLPRGLLVISPQCDRAFRCFLARKIYRKFLRTTVVL